MTRKTLAAAFAAAASLAVLGALVPAAPASAQTLTSESVLRRTVHVPRDKSLSFRLSSPATKIVVANPEIAKVTATSNASFYVQGVDFGSTNMLVYGPGGRLSEVIDVRVGYDADGLQQDLVAAFPGEGMQVRNLGEVLMLTGDVSDTGVQSGAERIAEKYAPEAVISRLTVRAPQQVVLEVRILEASRSAMQDIGVDLNLFNSSFNLATGGGLAGVAAAQGVLGLHGGSGSVTIDSQLSALEQKGLIRTLAKPNIVAVSGEKASFLAGGEFPFPVPQDKQNVAVQFRPYGVKLNFLPIVSSNGWIRMVVEPEVSQLDSSNALTVQGFTVPALSVRRASTTLDLKPGDTFAMAGLFQRGFQTDVNQTPWLGDIPVLGTLFRSSRWRRNETELLIIVTPRMANAEDRQHPKLDGIPGKEPTPLQMQFMGKALDKPMSRDNVPPVDAPKPVAEAMPAAIKPSEPTAELAGTH